MGGICLTVNDSERPSVVFSLVGADEGMSAVDGLPASGAAPTTFDAVLGSIACVLCEMA